MQPEKRLAPRKTLQCPARIMLGEGRSLIANTTDLAPGGMSVTVPEQLSSGQSCVVTFGVPLAGGLRPVGAAATVLYSASNGTEGFRIGLRFVEIDPGGNRAVSEFIWPSPNSVMLPA